MQTKKIVKKSITEHILDYLQNGAETTVDLIDDLLDTFLTSRPESYRRARAGMKNIKKQTPVRFKKQWSEIYRRKSSFYALLSKLKKDNLIEKTKSNGVTWWRITKKGENRNLREKNRLSSPPNTPWLNQVKKSKAVTIISYDIPEKLRLQRFWMREVLKLMGFSMIHRSVWVGTALIPKGFLKELERREIIDCIQIFEVTKGGTLEEVK